MSRSNKIVSALAGLVVAAYLFWAYAVHAPAQQRQYAERTSPAAQCKSWDQLYDAYSGDMQAALVAGDRKAYASRLRIRNVLVETKLKANDCPGWAW